MRFAKYIIIARRWWISYTSTSCIDKRTSNFTFEDSKFAPSRQSHHSNYTRHHQILPLDSISTCKYTIHVKCRLYGCKFSFQIHFLFHYKFPPIFTHQNATQNQWNWKILFLYLQVRAAFAIGKEINDSWAFTSDNLMSCPLKYIHL